MDEIKDSREKTIKDSGERTVFESGAVRDMHEGKGRFDLTPLEELNAVFMKYNSMFRPNMNEITDPNVMINNVYHYLGIIQSMIAGKKYVKGALIANLAEEVAMYMMRYLILVKEYTNIYDIAIGVSKHYENGAKKYGEDNWRKGIALTSYLDSSTRHFTKHLAGHDDEPHDIAAIWNMLGLAWTAVNIYNENKNANEEKDEEPTEEVEEIKDEVEDNSKELESVKETNNELDTTRDLYYQYTIESLNNNLSKYDLGIDYLGLDESNEDAKIEIYSNSLKPTAICTRRIYTVLPDNIAHMPLLKIVEYILNRYITETINLVIYVVKGKLENIYSTNEDFKHLLITHQTSFKNDDAGTINTFDLVFKYYNDKDKDNDKNYKLEAGKYIYIEDDFSFVVFISTIENLLTNDIKYLCKDDDVSKTEIENESDENEKSTEEISEKIYEWEEIKNKKNKYYSSIIKSAAFELKKYNIDLSYNDIDIYKPDLGSGAIVSVKDNDGKFECKFTVPDSILYTHKFDYMCDYEVVFNNIIWYTSKYILTKTIENILNTKLEAAIECKYSNLQNASVKVEYEYPDKNFKVIFIFGNDHNYSKIKLYEFEPEESLISSILDYAESTFEEISYIIGR